MKCARYKSKKQTVPAENSVKQAKNVLVLTFLAGFVLLNSACPAGFLGDRATGNGPYVSSSDAAINGTWQLKSVSCNFTEPSRGWQQAASGHQLIWQIANRMTQVTSTDSNGCTIRTEQSLHPETTNLGADFTVTTLRQACDPQCASACNSIGESSLLSISTINNQMSVIDSGGNTLCEKASQSGPMTMTFERVSI
jgi:hypothetical protein